MGGAHLTLLPVLIRQQTSLPSASQQQKQEGSFLLMQINLLLCLVTAENFSFHFAWTFSSVSVIILVL
jgi:hypothetical protein